eukprot:CAMPEP_0174950730 /NCGR_PEP_ID=MMETSP1355-20121228/94485_1 /TAXON_ID=464990 /ORGANISM="Hemiselmis tepida, Strain CCMP443" /LENGTH=293 /DNA_ID=CAMNT_0016198363 /DNA_START=120 /DNA_END=1001 /DNA_ORIENTATION=-
MVGRIVGKRPGAQLALAHGAQLQGIVFPRWQGVPPQRHVTPKVASCVTSQVRMLAMPASSYLDLEEKAKRLGVSAENLPLFMFDMVEERAKAAAAEALAEEKAKAAAALAEERAKAVEEKAKAAAAEALAEEKAKAAAALAEQKAINRESYFKLRLASVMQRFYLENFFREALVVLRRELPNDKRIQAEFPKMSIINDRVQTHWSLVQSKLAVDPTLQWPKTSGGTVLYGQLSETVHNTGMWQLFVGSKTPKDLLDLWKELAKRYDVPMEIVEEESAAAGEYEVNQYSQDSPG